MPVLVFFVLFLNGRFIIFKLLISVSPFCQIPEDTVKNSRFSYIEQGEPVSLDQLGKSKTSPDSGYQSYIQSCIAGLLKVKTVGTL